MVTFAIFGDIHGRQDMMYETALQWEQENQAQIDGVLQVGDFNTARTKEDLRHHYAPPKYQCVGDFPQYFAGLKQAPFLTIFIGGNHEAWGFLQQHNDGGFVAPNIYYLGRAGQIDVKGVKVSGLTGVFKTDKFKTPLETEPCYDWKYYRAEDIKKLEGKDTDILLFHDWIKPVSGIEISREQHVPQRVMKGNPTPARNLVSTLKPKHVFMGHLHDASLEGKIGETHVVGLSEFNEKKSSLSYQVISI
ncbi:metallophosphoesterase [Candidatus Woesearchaeota archaeon]|nr:metallophosphoesterase [Candidatus Woesearchaeota archaeon]